MGIFPTAGEIAFIILVFILGAVAIVSAVAGMLVWLAGMSFLAAFGFSSIIAVVILIIFFVVAVFNDR